MSKRPRGDPSFGCATRSAMCAIRGRINTYRARRSPTDDLQREPLKERHQVDRTVDRGQTIGKSIGYRDNLPRQEVNCPWREGGRHRAPLLLPIVAGAEKQPTPEHRPQRGRRYSPNATRRELASDNRR